MSPVPHPDGEAVADGGVTGPDAVRYSPPERHGTGDDVAVDDDVVEAELLETDAVAQAGAPPEVLGETAGLGGFGSQAEVDLEVLLGTARRERDEFLDALRRVQADFENYRKRVQRQQDELVDRAAERLVTDLLPALDAFDLAEAHLVGEENPSPAGLLQAAALLRDSLAKAGLERVDDTGADFDPTAHDAVEHVEGEPGAGPRVDTVLRPGYRWRGRVLRPAMVKVRG